LAVEIISPNEYAVDVDEKTRQYLQAGTKQVWLVYPRSKSISVYTSLRDVTIYTQEDDLSGGDVLPGFACKVADIFAIGE
jgi:Uma2 family endonuclease